LGCALASLFIWRRTLGSVSANTVTGPREELFYWITITFSQTLGAALALLAGLYAWTFVSRVRLFWAAFILTRPLGATVGDFFDKPLAKGGLDISRPLASLVLAAAIVALILLLPQRPCRHPASRPAA